MHEAASILGSFPSVAARLPKDVPAAELPRRHDDRVGMLKPSRIDYEVCIIGSGFAGLGMAIQLAKAGERSFVVLEQAASVGGTWRDNTYPGCACDIPSHLYSFSFEPKADWTRMYPPQREIEAYLNECARKHQLERHLRCNTSLLEARFNEETAVWHLKTSQGSFVVRHLVTAIGGLSRPSIPHLPGIESFEGAAFHSAQWRHDVQLEGKRIAVIGTGASAIQFVPQVVPKAAKLTLFQRTPAWIMPKLDREIPPAERKRYARIPGLRRLFRALIFWRQEMMAIAFTQKPHLMGKAQEMALAHLHGQVADPVLREKLTPKYTMGCKRVLISNDYFPSLTQANVEVVTEGIREVKPNAIVDSAGVEHPVDVLIYGTGFKASELLAPLRIVGREGVLLDDAWRTQGMHAHKGTMVAGFPNLFMLSGPNTGLGHNSIIFMIEAQIEHVLKLVRDAKTRRAAAVEVKAIADSDYNEDLQKMMRKTVWSTGCKSWYMDATGRNVTLWPSYSFAFRKELRRYNPDTYRWLGFAGA